MNNKMLPSATVAPTGSHFASASHWLAERPGSWCQLPGDAYEGLRQGRIRRQTAWTLRGQAEGGKRTQDAREANGLETWLVVGIYMMGY